MMKLAARRGLSAGRPFFVGDPWRPTPGRSVSLSSDALVVPVLLDGAVVAVLVVSAGRLAEVPLEQCIHRLGLLVLLIALAVDRVPSEGVLDREVGDVARFGSQFEAYPVGVRATYVAERERSRELALTLDEPAHSYAGSVRGLAIAVEVKDECTGGHLQRVCRCGLMLTAVVAPERADKHNSSPASASTISASSVPDAVSTNPGTLDPDEWELVKNHPGSRYSFLEDFRFLDGARETVRVHHECGDGKGYAGGLAGEEILLGAQMFPGWDAFDAMTREHPWRVGRTVEDGWEQVQKGTGSQLRPEAVDALVSLAVDKLVAVRDLSRETCR